ncbi:mannosyl-3-phosphoglycerate phosphatase [Pseudovibrio sp. W64]|nr:mannosyl-3-phosphoglycerate phosphatase [Pseudovibrio sp. W64]
MSPIVFTDLDDTLFQTAGKMSVDPNPQLIASHATNGKHSYMNEAQSAMFNWLNVTTRLIPVTARSTDALERCVLPFSDYKIASNGAVILREDGTLDPEWFDRTRKISDAKSEFLESIRNVVTERAQASQLRHWIVYEQQLPIYYCVKSNGDEAWLDEQQSLLDEVVGDQLFCHRNGNNLAYMPHEISKRSAVEYLIQEIAESDHRPIWGMGDSLTDLPFMEACQMMVVPSGSQTHNALNTLPKRGADSAR